MRLLNIFSVFATGKGTIYINSNFNGQISLAQFKMGFDIHGLLKLRIIAKFFMLLDRNGPRVFRKIQSRAIMFNLSEIRSNQLVIKSNPHRSRSNSNVYGRIRRGQPSMEISEPMVKMFKAYGGVSSDNGSWASNNQTREGRWIRFYLPL